MEVKLFQIKHTMVEKQSFEKIEIKDEKGESNDHVLASKRKD